MLAKKNLNFRYVHGILFLAHKNRDAPGFPDGIKLAINHHAHV